MMKKRMILLLSLVGMAAFLLTGCGNSTNQNGQTDDTQQQEIIETDQTNYSDDTTGSGNDAADDGANTDDTQNNTTAGTTQTGDIDTLTQKINDAVAAADAAQPSGTRDDDIDLFMEHKYALEALDRELDTFEDDLERQYRNNEINYEDFRTRDAEIERLEDSLDDAEDRLEDRFRMDD